MLFFKFRIIIVILRLTMKQKCVFENWLKTKRNGEGKVASCKILVVLRKSKSIKQLLLETEKKDHITKKKLNQISNTMGMLDLFNKI